MKRILVLSILSAFTNVIAAAPLPTTQATESIFNFDFTGQTPAPPYTAMLLSFDVQSAAAGSQLWYQIYGGLNGTNLLGTNWFNGITGVINTTVTYLPVLDGVFSVGVFSQAGSINLNSVGATGYLYGAGTTTKFIGTPASVPEPSSFALFSTALAVLGFTCRRKIGWRLEWQG